MFEVYTYFGRVLDTFSIPKEETHHKSSEQARKFLLSYESNTGKKAWIRYIHN